MRLSLWILILACLMLATAASANASVGSLTYKARIVHNGRGYISHVNGRIDLATGDFVESIEESYAIDWKVFPSELNEAQQTIPAIWQVGERSCQRFGAGLPRHDSPLLRHFVVGKIIGNREAVEPGATFMSGQLEVFTAEFGPDSFEVVCTYLGTPLVIVGRYEQRGSQSLVRDFAVLGAAEELYQYFIDEIEYSPRTLAKKIELPKLDYQDYVTFPKDGATDTPIRPVKDWLVFQAQLPNGRPLNLVFDSGAETMIVDDMVLQIDAQLEPAGEMLVSGAFDSRKMQLYEGFSFEIGGVQFHDLPVAGTMLTTLGIGADMRIHGIVGNEILQLCTLDLDLAMGVLRLSEPGGKPERGSEELALTFIHDLPHVKADLHNMGSTWLLVDTGQQTGLQVNIDYLENYNLGDNLVMNGFHSDITGGLRPRYMLEELDLSLAGHNYEERIVDAMMESSFNHEGVPVVGSIGFPLLARHFGGITFDYSRNLMYLRDPAENHVFAGQPDAWEKPKPWREMLLANAQIVPGGEGELVTEDKPVTKPEARGEDGVFSPSERARLLPNDSEGDDPRANYPWYEEHKRLSAALDDAQGGTEDSAAEALPQPGVRLNRTLLGFAEQLGDAMGLTARGLFAVQATDDEPAETVEDPALETSDHQFGRSVFKKGGTKLEFDPIGNEQPEYPSEDEE